jgi:predicted Holliday junction resolvase-like endonuclease
MRLLFVCLFTISALAQSFYPQCVLYFSMNPRRCKIITTPVDFFFFFVL